MSIQNRESGIMQRDLDLGMIGMYKPIFQGIALGLMITTGTRYQVVGSGSIVKAHFVVQCLLLAGSVTFIRPEKLFPCRAVLDFKYPPPKRGAKVGNGGKYGAGV